MLLYICELSIISIILIFVVHHLINFFKDSLTSPKIKDIKDISTINNII